MHCWSGCIIMLGKTDEAHGWLQRALTDLDLYPREHKRIRAMQLETQIVL